MSTVEITEITEMTQYRHRKPTTRASTLYELEEMIRNALKNRGKTSLRQLAEETGISHTHIMNVEHGKSVCIVVLNRLANYYGIQYQIENFGEREGDFIS